MGQHYVSRFYLKPWAHNGRVFYLNLKNGRIRPQGLRGVANETFFYRLHDLTAEELDFIEHAAIKPCSEPLREVHRNFIKLFCLPSVVRKFAATNNLDAEYIATLDDLIADGAESYHKRIEDSLKRFVDSMLGGDVTFFSDKERAANFLYAISVQFTRTKRAKQAAISQIGTKYKNCDVERLWSVLSHIVATSLGYSLYMDKANFKLVLVENRSEDPLITTDQPIINLHPSLNGKAPDKLEFFYPLSPRKAMLLLERSNPAHAEPSISQTAVNSYNALMLKNAYEQVFSDSREYLETIKKLHTC